MIVKKVKLIKLHKHITVKINLNKRRNLSVNYSLEAKMYYSTANLLLVCDCVCMRGIVGLAGGALLEKAHCIMVLMDLKIIMGLKTSHFLHYTTIKHSA